MNHYLVKIKMVLSSYEKHVRYIVLAWDEAQAQATAIYAECHNTDAIEWRGIDEASDGGEFIYRTYGAAILPQKEIATLSKYLPTFAFNLEDMKDSGIFEQLEIIHFKRGWHV